MLWCSWWNVEVETPTFLSFVDKLAKGKKLDNFVKYLKFLNDRTKPSAYVRCWWNVGCRWNIGICSGCNNSCYVHLNYGLTDCYGTKLLNCTIEWHKEAIEWEKKNDVWTNSLCFSRRRFSMPLFFLGQLNENLKRKRRDLHFE